MTEDRRSFGAWLIVGLLILICAGAVAFLLKGRTEPDEIRLAEPSSLRPEIRDLAEERENLAVDRDLVMSMISPEPTTDPTTIGAPTVPEKPPETDEEYLDSVVCRWVYVAYGNVGTVRMGSFRYNSGEKRQFELREGESTDRVTLTYIDHSKAKVRYGDAVAELPLIESFEVDRRAMLDPMTHFDASPEAVNKAKMRYWELYGKRLAYEGRFYEPAEGERMPPTEPLTKEELESRVEDYITAIQERYEKRRNQDETTLDFEKFRDSLHKKFGVGKYADAVADDATEAGTATESQPD